MDDRVRGKDSLPFREVAEKPFQEPTWTPEDGHKRALEQIKTLGEISRNSLPLTPPPSLGDLLGEPTNPSSARYQSLAEQLKRPYQGTVYSEVRRLPNRKDGTPGVNMGETAKPDTPEII